MAAYMQLGHQSRSDILDPPLSKFTGIVLSPVNDAEPEVQILRDTAVRRRGLDVVFDPQLYAPRTERKSLRGWSYFPSDVETADVASPAWWDALIGRVVEAALRIRPDGVCAPIEAPKKFTDRYYLKAVRNADALAKKLPSTIRPLLTAVVELDDLAEPTRPMEIASILTRSDVTEVYLILASDLDPQQELLRSDELCGALRLIHALANAGCSVFVAFSGADALLWRSAGAAACGAGKFFNLRRWTPGRFEPPPARGGGQLPNWFEEGLLGHLREADLLRARQHGCVSELSLRSPYAAQIFAQIEAGEAWLGLGQKQFLYWFASMDARVQEGLDPLSLLRQAEANWSSLADLGVHMERADNDGRWIAPWKEALEKFRSQES